jgi:hypothetical protein
MCVRLSSIYDYTLGGFYKRSLLPVIHTRVSVISFRIINIDISGPGALEIPGPGALEIPGPEDLEIPGFGDLGVLVTRYLTNRVPGYVEARDYL